MKCHLVRSFFYVVFSCGLVFYHAGLLLIKKKLKHLLLFVGARFLLAGGTLAQSDSSSSEKLLVKGERFEDSLGGVQGEWEGTGGSVTVQAAPTASDPDMIMFGTEGINLRFNFKEPVNGNVDLSFDLSRNDAKPPGHLLDSFAQGFVTKAQTR